VIIKATRIKAASGPRNLLHHLLGKPQENEEIHLIAGSPDEIGDIFTDAAKNGDRYAIRHAQFSPDQAMDRDAALNAVRAYLAEFGSRDIDGDMAHVLVVEHRKKRADHEAYDRHWHAAIPERLPSTGRIMDSKMYARHERLARTLEIEHGHAIRKGRHNKYVVESLREQGKADLAAKLDGAEIASGTLPQTAYTSDRVQIAKREGRDLPAARQVVKVAWASSDSAASFAAALAENGLTCEQGRKAGTWIVNDSSGKLVGSVDRLCGIPKTDVSARLGGDTPDPPKRRRTASAEADVHTHRENTDMADTATSPVASAEGNVRTGKVLPFAAQGQGEGKESQNLLQMIMALIRRLFGMAGSYESRAVRPENPDDLMKMVKEIKREMTEMRSAIAEHRLAIDVLKGHDAAKPSGIMATINGEKRQWAKDREPLAADEARKARIMAEQESALAKAKAKWLPKAQAKAEENAKENAADLKKAAALRHTADALVHGDPKTMEAAKVLVSASKRADPEHAIKDIRPDRITIDLTKVAKEWTPPTKPEVAQEVNAMAEDLNQSPGLRGFGRR